MIIPRIIPLTNKYFFVDNSENRRMHRHRPNLWDSIWGLVERLSFKIHLLTVESLFEDMNRWRNVK